jgi:hypothetical protein
MGLVSYAGRGPASANELAQAAATELGFAETKGGVSEQHVL